MAQCEVVRVPRPGRQTVEVRAAPAHEPLASCRFEWPARWRVHTCAWAPPPRGQASVLFGMNAGPGDALVVSVARFGLEVDALGWLESDLGTQRARAATPSWRGLSVAALDEPQPGPAWRAVVSGPALHLLEAHGQARRWLDRAAATLRSLTPFEPPAEGVRGLSLGPLTFSALAAWRADTATERVPHGHAVAVLRRTTSEGHLAGWLRVHVVDRRVLVGVNPDTLRAETAPDWASQGFTLGEADAATGASGPLARHRGEWQGRSVEVTSAERQIGPCWVRADVVTPGLERAPVSALNGRRALDVALATARVSLRP